MGLDISLMTSVYSANITHNLNEMAGAAGIYKYLWRPEEVGIYYAENLIDPLTKGLEELKNNPEEYKKYNSENGYGMYEDFVEFVENYICACKKYPDSFVKADR